MPLLLTFYGDDLTGSTDAMEALALSGIPTVLFLDAPMESDLLRFPDCRAVGIAGMSRSESPAWMDQKLPPVFSALRELGAPICHYKVCSTFDSSPTVGSIGRAIELGRKVMGSNVVPMVVGAPVLKRYVTFGNLFATVNGETHRIDRHPTMSCHPVTPMDEGDLRRHLARQTNLRIDLVDILALQAGRGLERFEELSADGAAIILFDTLDASSLREAGRAIWESRSPATTFVAGSSGVEYALLAWWEAQGVLPAKPPILDAAPVDRLLIASGSCSPLTGKQIDWALANGFEAVPVDPVLLVSDHAELLRAQDRATAILSAGGSPIVYTAAGPKDVVKQDPDFGRKIGLRLSAITAEVLRRTGVKRIVSSGGDTSGHIGRALEIQALTVIRPFAPGSPLCRLWSKNPQSDGVEILLKGGQVGSEGLFGQVRAGKLS